MGLPSLSIETPLNRRPGPIVLRTGPEPLGIPGPVALCQDVSRKARAKFKTEAFQGVRQGFQFLGSQFKTDGGKVAICRSPKPLQIQIRFGIAFVGPVAPGSPGIAHIDIQGQFGQGVQIDQRMGFGRFAGLSVFEKEIVEFQVQK